METTHTTEPKTETTAVIASTIALFPLGQIMATPGALEALADAYNDDRKQAGEEGAKLLQRHQTGDWGTLDKHDHRANVEALKHCARMFSVYFLPDGVKVWIITEADRAYTTILLPGEY